MLELLAPAGSMEALRAAVQNGANAVYLGCGMFNARQGAKNFTPQTLTEAVKYCHVRGVVVHLTLNTLVSDREMPQLAELIRHAALSGVDAFIVQDLGVVQLCRQIAPHVPIHGSTQLTVHNLPGVLMCAGWGMSRVVLSRELSREEIRAICAQSPIEIEVFGHGALCMCYSGQCYLSAAIGGRSGNRGLCAQPCRMSYGLGGGKPEHPLSLKDLSLAEHLSQLEQAGVHTLKIEGRMKRPEYTALVTRIYKNALTQRRTPTREELEQLQAVFSREGFTDGYFAGHKGPDMFGTRQEDNGREARELYKQAQAIYQTEPEPPTVPVKLFFSARAETPMTLLADDGAGHRHEAAGLPAEPALRRATTEEEVRSALSKTGGTVFYPEQMEVDLEDGLRASAAAINAMRRQCLESLALQRKMPPQRRIGEWQPGVQRLSPTEAPGWIFSFLSVDQLSSPILHAGPDMIWLPLREMADNLPLIRALTQQGLRFAAVLDRIIFDGQWAETLRLLRQVQQAGVSDLVCGNLGQLPIVHRLGMKLHGDFGLNVMNSQTVRELSRLGLASCTLSFEMNLAQIRDMNPGMDCQLMAYGRLPLMVTENAILPPDYTGKPTLTDKTGRSFPIVPEAHGRATLYNAETLWLADKREELSRLGLRWLRLSFTTEKPREIEAVLRAYQSGEGSMPGRTTRGLYYRGVQ